MVTVGASSGSGRPEPPSRAAVGFAIGALLLLVIPLYFASALLLIRSGLFSNNKKPLSDEQFKAVVAFLGTALAASATVIGALATWWHNKRAREQLAYDNMRDREQRTFDNERKLKQQALDTVIKGVELLTHEDKYAPKAQVGGAIAALVHLGHPVIAMRVLGAAWEARAVHPSTACWLIGEVFRLNYVVSPTANPGTDITESSEASIIEAIELLRSHATELPHEIGDECHCYWPYPLYRDWPSMAPTTARTDFLVAVLRTITSKPRGWWRQDYGWAILLLDRAIQHDENDLIKRSAALLLEPLIRSLWGGPLFDGDNIVQVQEMKDRMKSVPYGDGSVLGAVDSIVPALETWAAK